MLVVTLADTRGQYILSRGFFVISELFLLSYILDTVFCRHIRLLSLRFFAS